MAYSQAVVLMGGIAHIPLLITPFWIIDKRLGKAYNDTLKLKKEEELKRKEEELAKKKILEDALAAKQQSLKELEGQEKQISLDSPNENN
tara:strand:+ start:240 stop:509 length:270 start_codon:yes stop_codon:yes gene_type:complete